ncbi:MAG: FtsX-like permease family protein [Sediminibacterium sp.]|nr:FtsX-like permease family protein [Sediminibacterium sp.]
MIQHFIKIAFRNFRKYKAFSILNVSALAIGMAGAMLLLIWIQHQLSIDQFHEKKENLYKVFANQNIDGQIQTSASIPIASLTLLQSGIPEIRNITGIRAGNKLLQFSETKLNVVGNVVDPAFLDMFSFPLISGNKETALQDSKSIVISEKLAKSLFRTEDPMNKVIRADGKDNFIVKGVCKDPPDNTQFGFDYLVSDESGGSQNAQPGILVELQRDANIAAVNDKMNAIIARDKTTTEKTTLFLYPLQKLWLQSHFENGKPAGGGIDLIRFLGLVAGIILLIGCINFMNLSTARSIKRAKEVGVRKILGGSRQMLIGQFIGESVFMSFVAGILALGIVAFALPSFNTVTGGNLVIRYADPYFWIGLISFILLTGIMAGSYPAFFLSSFKPVKALQGLLEKRHVYLTPKKILFVFQFVVAIVLINITILVQKQVRHLKDRETGFVREHLVFHSMTNDLRKSYAVLKNELLHSGSVVSVSASDIPITRSGKQTKIGDIDFEVRSCQENFISTNGLQLIAGRDIDVVKFPGDTNACIINESAVIAMNLENPVGTTLKDNTHYWRVIGIVKNFINHSPLQAVTPVMIRGSNDNSFINLRVSETKSMVDNIVIVSAIFKKYNSNYITELQFADDDYALKVRGLKVTALLTNIFASIAIFISCLGLLGLVMYTAESRSKEMSIRKVFGAGVVSLNFVLAKDFIRLVIIAIIVASPVSWLLMDSFLRPLYYRTSLSPFILFQTAGIALLITAITIGSHPSGRLGLIP